jgi:hypothetical protein
MDTTDAGDTMDNCMIFMDKVDMVLLNKRFSTASVVSVMSIRHNNRFYI